MGEYCSLANAGCSGCHAIDGRAVFWAVIYPPTAAVMRLRRSGRRSSIPIRILILCMGQ